MKNQSVTVLLFNEAGQILCVSRRDDHTQMGLPGGKVDEGETLEQAIARETLEETGLAITNLRPYFVREDGEHMNTTFLAEYSGEIHHASDEGIVRWGTFEEDLKAGPFKAYNTALEEFSKVTPKLHRTMFYKNPATGNVFYIKDVLEPVTQGQELCYLVKTIYSRQPFYVVRASAFDIRLIEKEYPFADTLDKIGKEMSVLDKAIQYASTVHLDVNQYYGKPGRKYLYDFHLTWAYRVALRFIHLVPEEDRDWVLAAVWCHDIIEDGRETYNDVRKVIGEKAAALVFAVTNNKGHNRDERADEDYYLGIRNEHYATFVKLCDRIANVENARMEGSRMFDGYREEQVAFHGHLHASHETTNYNEMWKYLTTDLFGMTLGDIKNN